jgi:hypothetical protein
MTGPGRKRIGSFCSLSPKSRGSGDFGSRSFKYGTSMKDRRATSENNISGGAGRENDGCSDEAAAVKEGL